MGQLDQFAPLESRLGGTASGSRREGQPGPPGSPGSMAWRGLATEFLQVPAVTRTYTAACVLTTAAVQLELLSPFQLYFNPHLVFRKFQTLQVPLLPHAGGGLLPRPHGRLRLHVSLRGRPYDPAGAPGQPLLPGPGPHGHAGVRVEPPQPPGEGQLLRPPHLPGTIPALGAHGLLNAAGQLHPCGPAGPSPPLVLPTSGPVLVPPWAGHLCRTLGTMESQSRFWTVEGGLGSWWISAGIAVGHIYYFLEDVFPNQPGGKRLLLTPGFLKLLLDTPEEDPNYLPLPEEQPQPPQQ
ncbi:derlin-3 isoform X5 [Camelus dromedarius]|uniref:derlin-3 isoform X5 n=1 Tax=Camelus dromedarius TaxID=9838 RepID=UPI001262D308|nr:derlin-3 isoform X1 [Camelus dromedarius]